MKVSLSALSDRLGLERALQPYETMPWTCYDSTRNLTCSAEIRMNGDSSELEAEAQFLYDDPQPDRPAMEQICYIRAEASHGQFAVKQFRVRNEPYGDDIANWQMKGCDFFRELIRHLQMNEIPDIDILLEEAFSGSEQLGGGGRGGGGRKPKINTAALMDMKKSRGF